MYNLLNNNLRITENHLKVLSLFTSGYNKSLYIREVNRMLELSPRTAQLTLDYLESKGVLHSTMLGKIKTYSLRKNQTSKYYLTLAESYKTTLFMDNHALIMEIIEKISPLISGIGLIFGSYAKGIEYKGSDIDIFLAGEADKKTVKEVSKSYGIEINLITYPLEKYKSSWNKDILIKEVIENHIAILDIDGFVSSVIKNE
ncbi:MAG TPA: nucleotidyltransferase domain-containing protein [Methanofastidiosum sp.]|jgi:predicted nucleotidyltransferase|nr:nucleotidyltransferase domain-containing protein [Methanofastidiosum sp.]